MNPSNWDKYINKILASYRVTPNLVMTETPFFLVYGRDPNLPLHHLLQPMQWFLGDPDSGLLILKAHWLALAITKTTLDENCFRTAQKTSDRKPPSFNIGDRVYFKNKQPGKWDLKWRPGYRTVQIEHNGYFLHIKHQATGKVWSCYGCSTWTSSTILEHWYTIWQSWKIHQPPCEFTKYHSQWLIMMTPCT